jgi:6-phosphogluconolactonase/glucosamine-6-phosphate isomerase/deaminase
VTIQHAQLEVLPAATWADRVAEALAGRFRSDPELRVCLPTGSTPLPVYARLPGVLEAAGISVGRAPGR